MTRLPPGVMIYHEEGAIYQQERLSKNLKIVMTSTNKLVNEFLKLIDVEQEAQAEEILEFRNRYTTQELQRRGVAIGNLRLSAMRTGLGGQSVVEFEPAPETSDLLPAHQFRVGDIVAVEEHVPKSKQSQSKSSSTATTTEPKNTGVVYRITKSKIIVTFKEDLPEILQAESKVRLCRLANEITFERMRKALRYLQKLDPGESGDMKPASALLSVLYGKQNPGFEQGWQKMDLKFFDEGLNDSQREAVKFALGAREVALIHGPPGTGKTYTCVEIIKQLVKAGKRVLVCGPSNISVDNLVERLAKSKLDIVRIGNPARILESVLAHSLEVRVRSSDEGQLVNDVRTDMDRTFQQMQKAKSRMQKRELYGEIKFLRKELKQRESNVISNIVKQAQVVLSTLNGVGSQSLYHEEFDVTLIDEATQSLEPECWIAILKSKKVILAGDHLQLPPTIKSMSDNPKVDKKDKSEKITTKMKSTQLTKVDQPHSLEVTLFDRMLKEYGDRVRKMLTVQYRMNEAIMKFSSNDLYEGRLVAHESVKSHLLHDLDEITSTEETSVPVVFIDTAGAGMYEQLEGDGNAVDKNSLSRFNEGEIGIVETYLEKLTKAGMKPENIAIISPYNAQVTRLSDLLEEKYPGLEIDSVDGFQGREKEAVIVSLVRSNDTGEVGFLKDFRRLNVAITRPKRHLCVIGDSETLSKGDIFLKKLCEYLSDDCELRFPE
ncbi:hypothetical protein HK098_005394 [Nowakowskiella sp. JEL0407]|nr:hypothetical protein HK098_005394 [Nowakowskiella sp. JEL0407]